MSKLYTIRDSVIGVMEHIDIIDINLFVLIVIVILNIFFMGLYWKCLKEYKCMPYAIHITERLLKKDRISRCVKEKLQRLYICDDWESVIKKHYCKKVSLIIGIIVVINIASICIFQDKETKVNLINNQYIKRPNYGEPTDKVHLKVKYKDTKGKNVESDLNIDVEPNRLSDEQEAELIKNVKIYIRKTVLGNNKKYGEIRNKLKLITSYNKDKNIHISWKLDDYGLVSSNGDIVYSNVKKKLLMQGMDILIIAKIKYFEHEYEYPLYMTVFCKEQGEEYIYLNKLKKNISDLNQEYSKDGRLVLPRQVEDRYISYSEEKKDNRLENCIMVAIMGVILIYIICKAMVKDIDSELDKKNMVLNMYLGEIINKLQLLLCAGLHITAAWEKICVDYLKEKDKTGKTNYAYEEMVYTYKRICMGMPIREAFEEFGRRVSLPQYIKVSSLILQSMRVSSEGFIQALEQESSSLQEHSKEIYIRQGEKLGVKLLVPMMIMMLLTMIIVMVPAFISM